LSYRLFRAFMRGSHEGSLNAQSMKMADADCIRDVAERIVKQIAERGKCVIVGRGSAYYLQGRRDVFNVFVYAPEAEKMKRLQARGKSAAEAAQLIESVDRDRAAYIKRYFGVEWPDRQRFDLMINSTVGEDAVVETILDGVGRLERRMEAAAPASPPQKQAAP
ncbi:MAG TPA: cytidylate kinase-like family protein, partial [Candidatus Acidoferrales bacterium]|nr:cytidylate kinase-like family protein [Candidatus Acidoferrales bacterium]